MVPGRQSTAVPDAPPGILFPGDLPRGLANNDLNNLAPRIGLAWDIFGDGKTTLRTGYGVFYESINADSLAQENPPFAGFAARSAAASRIRSAEWDERRRRRPLRASSAARKIAAYPGVDCPLFPLPVGGVFTGLALRTPYVQSFNLSLQRQITPSLMVETAYAGKIGIKLPALRTYNPAAFRISRSTVRRPPIRTSTIVSFSSPEFCRRRATCWATISGAGITPGRHS